MTRQWWQLYLGGGALALIAYPAMPAGVPQDAFYVAVGASCVAAIMVGVRLRRPSRRLPWLLMAGGQLSWVSADVLYSWYEAAGRADLFPTPADGLYIAAYPLLGAGLAVLIRLRRRGPDPAGLIDSVIVTVSFGLLSWVLVAESLINGTDAPWIDRLVAVAYPAGDILLLALLALLITTAGARTAAFRFLTGAVLLQILADSVFAATELSGGYNEALDLLWLASYVLWGAAALHPSMTQLGDSTTQEPQPLSPRRVIALTAAVLVAPLTLAAQLAVGDPGDAWAVVVCSTALFLLVVARMSLAIREVVATASQRDQLQGVLSHEVAHDSLTGLANRASVLAQVEAALHRGQRAGTLSALLFIDLDRFKAVNDKFGHRAGDEVLRETARRMRQCARDGDTVGRLGGDEFAVLLELLSSESEAIDLADRIVEALAVPFDVGGINITVGASVGIAYSMDAGTKAAQLLHEADVASHRAREAGRGRSHVFGDALRRELSEQNAIETALGAALANGEFVLYYQPVVAVETGDVEGYEALIRWPRPGLGLQQPDTFIPVAEKSDLICDIDRWGLREATRQLAQWSEDEPERYADLTVAVNISGRHLADVGIISDVTGALASSGLAAHRLVLEITESVLIDVPAATAHLVALREMGISISIDDFGTGYTSIAQLQQLPVDTLKIDRQFVTSTVAGARDLLMLMVNAAHSCGLSVVAEGVETDDQLEALRALSVDSVQGFLLARPQPADVVQGRLGTVRDAQGLQLRTEG
ncbi:diguanylate cyclase (GGDEF)-like protein [Aeromicrobium panaciterrae]|uniref:Diguanylate cyclase (GGDEF)-like protein n=1 Tax=Aeromicrobium panaciterrae TaxID=363861 RepID=A0ABU1UQF9_9ACTN|nr:EAL domain-containing protein [Aeromicrobium panaciterrae]MDR7087420.1 diguanylate cyclase (GGDEF)-like protein [Aeromicrobium panaciterrae]